MANSYIYNMTDDWSNSSLDWVAIDMNVTDNGSTANSALINLSVNGANAFTVYKSGDAFIAGGIAANSAYANKLVDGIMFDYTPGIGRIMLGVDDGLTVYAGNATHVTNTTVLMAITNTGIMSLGNMTANVQLGANTVLGTPSVAVGYGNSNSSINFVVTNANTGGNTSADFTAYDSAGLSGVNFIDMGIAGNTWSNASWTIGGASDGYLYTGNTNLSIGTAGGSGSNGYINFFTRGTLLADERMRIAGNGYVGIGTTSPSNLFTVSGTNAASTIRSQTQNLDTGVSSVAQHAVYHGSTSALVMAAASGYTALTSTTAAPLIISTTATERMRIAANGFIGIGTTAPTAKLDLRLGDIRLSRTAEGLLGDAAIYFGNAATNYIFGGDTSNIMAFAVNSSERMRIAANGNIGIGTTAPSQKLQVAATTNQLSLTTGTNELVVRASSTEVALYTFQALPMVTYTNNAERMRITSDGNVGIANSAPNATLAVTGTANVSGNVALASNTLILGSGGLASAQAANGWSILPNGMKANYGWVAANTSVANVTFTSPFTTACLHVFLTPVSATATGPYLIQPANTTVAPIRTTSATAANVAYYAIGY